MRWSFVGKRIVGIRAHQKLPARYQNHATGRIGSWTASSKGKDCSEKNEVACHSIKLDKTMNIKSIFGEPILHPRIGVSASAVAVRGVKESENSICG